MAEQISSVIIVKVRGTLGPRHDNLKSISMLNRRTTEKQECIEYDADPRHRELLLVQLDLASALGATTSFEKLGLTTPRWPF